MTIIQLSFTFKIEGSTKIGELISLGDNDSGSTYDCQNFENIYDIYKILGNTIDLTIKFEN